MPLALAQNLALMTSGNLFNFDVLDSDCTRLMIRREYGRGCDLIVYAPCELSALCAAFDLFKIAASGAWRIYNVERNMQGIPISWDNTQVGEPRLAATAAPDPLILAAG